MYLIIGKKGCIQCQVLQNMLLEKKLAYHYVDRDELSQKIMLYLKGYFPTFPMVLEVKSFPDFQRMLSHFRDV